MCKTLRHLPANVTLTGSSPRAAALWEVHPDLDDPPRPRRRPDRPRSRGAKIGTSDQLAAIPGETVMLTRYGRTSKLTVYERRCLWDGAFRSPAAWLRLTRSSADEVWNLRGWLTTVVGRICLDMLRSRAARREQPLDGRVPDPLVTFEDDDHEREVVLADAVGVALLVALDTLTPAERLAFVLHDLFAVSFSEVGAILGRSAAAAEQLGSQAVVRSLPGDEGGLAVGTGGHPPPEVSAWYALAKSPTTARGAAVARLIGRVVAIRDGGALLESSEASFGQDSRERPS